MLFPADSIKPLKIDGLTDDLDDSDLEAIGEVVIRTWLGQLPMYSYDSISDDADDEDEEYDYLSGDFFDDM